MKHKDESCPNCGGHGGCQHCIGTGDAGDNYRYDAPYLDYDEDEDD